MVFHSCFNNLKGFAISRPPLVVFTLCLAALAIATLTLARMVSQTDSLPNPDVKLDWNLLLERMAELDLCVIPETGESMTTLQHNYNTTADEETVTALFGVAQEVHNTLHNNTHISGLLPAHLLGLPGKHNVLVSFRIDVNTSSAHLPSSVCASFSGPRSLLPETMTPPSCSPQTTGQQTGLARMIARPEGPPMADDWCEEGTALRLAYHSNPNLTAMLTLHDRSVVNLHLMHTSYFLIVMAMTLVCYALLKGKPTSKQQISSTIEKVPLDP